MSLLFLISLSFIRGFLSSDSVHPVKLVQDLIIEGLAEKWSVSMTTEPLPFLLSAKQMHSCSHNIDSTLYYWIPLLKKDSTTSAHSNVEKDCDQSMVSDCQGHRDTRNLPSATCVTADKVERVRSKLPENFRSACSLDVHPERENGPHMLRPSLHPQMEEILTKKEEWTNNTGSPGETVRENNCADGNEEPCESCNGVTSVLFGISGTVFRNVPINLWAVPAFHELLIRGVCPSESIRSIEQKLEMLLTPCGVSLVTGQGGLHLRAQPMGLVGEVFVSAISDDVSNMSITVCLNLDLLAVLLFSLPDWKLLWSHDPRFLKQFALCPSPGMCFRPFSLFPEFFSFDISFWTGPAWEEKTFHALVREASCGSVELIKLMDTFSHPDLSQTSYCYRLTYHSHTHALSHTQALHFHKQLESLLSSRLQVTIR